MNAGLKSASSIVCGGDFELLFDDSASLALRSDRKILLRLIRQQTNETFEPPPFPHWERRGVVFAVYRRLIQRLSYLPHGPMSEVYDKLMTRLYPEGRFFSWTKANEFDRALNDAEKLLDRGDFAVLKRKGEIIAAGAYKLGGITDDGREIFELTKFITLPEYRGNGYFGVVREALIRRIRERHPDAPIMTFTKNRTVIHRCLFQGWKPLSMEGYSAAARRIGRTGIGPNDMAALEHWRGFIFDPGAVR
ncbi:MAG: hypothetical protein ACU826_10305 [Gammaproteobacteria bacterium]